MRGCGEELEDGGESPGPAVMGGHVVEVERELAECQDVLPHVDAGDEVTDEIVSSGGVAKESLGEDGVKLFTSVDNVSGVESVVDDQRVVVGQLGVMEHVEAWHQAGGWQLRSGPILLLLLRETGQSRVQADHTNHFHHV